MYNERAVCCTSLVLYGYTYEPHRIRLRQLTVWYFPKLIVVHSKKIALVKLVVRNRFLSTIFGL